MPWLDGRHGLPRPVGEKVVINTTGAPLEVFEKVIVRFNETTSGGAVSTRDVTSIVVFTGLVISLILVFILMYAVISGKFFFIEKPFKPILVGKRGKKPEFYRYMPSYKYTGLRRVIRELYLRFLGRLSSIGVIVKPGYTPREVARAAKSLIGDKGFKVAYLYEDLMYSRRQPTEKDVEKFKEVTGVAGD